MKYYTPEIEEFHVGFEFQGFADNGWEDESIRNWRELYTIIDRYSHTAGFRVKHLDREDIESLGWRSGLSGIPMDEYSGWQEFMRPNYTIVLFDTGEVRIREEKTEGSVLVVDTIFQGTINNKSELKRILKQIGI